ncbi:MAG: hypothetical protein M3Y03_07340, partial [Verrucomicrobiota bacterium]|nr:hypothetical protein [Verrucomicrobiota bacterium]
PIGWMPLLTLAVVRAFVPELELRKRFLFFRGCFLTLGLVALWGIPALIQTEGLFFDVGIGRHVVERSVGVLEGHGATSLWIYLAMLPFYFVTIFVTFAPWSIKLPWLAKTLWRKRDATDLYLIAGTAVIFLIFTLVRTKLPHYTLPAFPLLALLLAKTLSPLTNTARFVRRTAFVGLVGGMAIVTLFSIAASYFPSQQLIRKARATDHLRA